MAAARHLAAHLPATTTALRAGHISYLQALTIAEESYRMPPELLAGLEELVVPAASRQSPGQTRAALRRVIARLQPASLAEDEQAARSVTDAAVSHGDDGAATP